MSDEVLFTKGAYFKEYNSAILIDNKGTIYSVEDADLDDIIKLSKEAEIPFELLGFEELIIDLIFEKDKIKFDKRGVQNAKGKRDIH